MSRSQGQSPTPFEPGSFVDRTSARAWPAAFFQFGCVLTPGHATCLAPSMCVPQTEVATVFGTVTDPSGAVIPGAQVTIVLDCSRTKVLWQIRERVPF
jgi:hypothetical protein